MDKQNIKKRKIEPDKRKTILLNIRVTPEISRWLKENEISPTGLFYEALKDAGFKAKA